LVRVGAGLAVVVGLVAALVVSVLWNAPAERDGRPPPVVAVESPFIGHYVPVTRKYGPNQVPFPGGHTEYLQGCVYTTVAEALTDPRLRELDNCRILLLDEVHEEQLAVDAAKLPHGISIESVWTDAPTQWMPPEGADRTRPLLLVTGGARLAVRNVTFNGLARVEVAVSWVGPGPGCQLHAVRVTKFTRSGVLLRDPAGEAGEPVQLSRVRVNPESSAQVDACVEISATGRPARHLRLTECRLEGKAVEGVVSSGGMESFEMTRCRLFDLQTGVRFRGPGKLRATFTGNTTAKVAALVRVDALPRVEDKDARLLLRANLFFAADDAVRFGESASGSTELFRGSEGNWCGDEGCLTPIKGLAISRRPGLIIGLDPSRDAEFLRYSASNPLATAGPDRQPVGVPPG
jgi:hypothetical protein